MRLRAGGQNSGLADAPIPNNVTGAGSSISENMDGFDGEGRYDAEQPSPTVKQRGKGKDKKKRRKRVLGARPTSISWPRRRRSYTNVKWRV